MVVEKDPVENMLAQAVLEEQTKPTCRHHWVIEPANGPVSWGVCQVCHEGKEFKNSIADADRDN